MADDEQQASGPDPLTAWWFGVLPALFGARAAPFNGSQPDGEGRPSTAQPDFQALLAGGQVAGLASIAQALQPLATNLERAHGGLADAFGLAPLRDLADPQQAGGVALAGVLRGHFLQRRAGSSATATVGGAVAAGAIEFGMQRRPDEDRR